MLESKEDNAGVAERKWEGGAPESILRSRGKRWRCDKSKGSECCEREDDLSNCWHIGLGWVKGRRDTPHERIYGLYAPNQVESKGLVEGLEL
jgi:hypothetical protein